ncbi:MAG: hypothetical protein FWE66_02825 [Oscillospiraceae bacterium]|nr:hypothetical protein [Oscillospiraceae bacterium]
MANTVSTNHAAQMAPKNQYQPKRKLDYIEPSFDEEQIKTISDKVDSGMELSDAEMRAVSKTDSELYRTAEKADKERTKLRDKMMEDPASGARVARDALSERAKAAGNAGRTEKPAEKAVTRAMENEARGFAKRFDQKEITRAPDSAQRNTR